MKWLFLLVMILLLITCINTDHKSNKTRSNKSIVIKTDSLEIESQLKELNNVCKSIEKALYDSVKRINPEDVDYSNITGGLQKKYDGSKNEMLKTILGFELAKNYLLCFRNTNEINNLQKSDSLFFSFLSYKNGKVAIHYLRIDTAKVQFLSKNWNNFSPKDKETILFYGLLRGFNNGLPEILKNK